MDKVSLAILSLLAHQPLSDYDLKQQMNDRMTPFMKVSNNQIYPQITKLADANLIQLHAVTQDSFQPEKKLCGLTELGLTELKKITKTDFGDLVVRNSFQVKLSNAWLLEPSEILGANATEKALHQQKRALFTAKLQHMKQQSAAQLPEFGSWAILKYGQTYEAMYVDSCDTLASAYQQQLD